jgi:hypothetical protein
MVFLEIEHFTDVGNYFCKRRRISSLYLIKIHHDILDMFYQITFLWSDLIKTKSKNCLPRSNRHGRKRSYTEKYGDIRRKKRSFTISVHGGHIRARRYTIVIRDHVIRQNTVVYGEIRTVYGRLRAYTNSVIIDLGTFVKKPFRHIEKRFHSHIGYPSTPLEKNRTLYLITKLTITYVKRNMSFYHHQMTIGSLSSYKLFPINLVSFRTSA